MEQDTGNPASPKVIPENIRAKWGAAAKDGYQAVPHSLFKFQHHLGLSSSELVTLLNVLDFWWDVERKPFPSAATLANRMGVDARSVQRNLKRLESMGYVRREPVPDSELAKQYNLDGLVRRLNYLMMNPGAEKPPRRRSGKKGADGNGVASVLPDIDGNEYIDHL